MKSQLFAIGSIVFLLYTYNAVAAGMTTSDKDISKKKTNFINAQIGYRVDNLDWNIASDITGTSTPNILSELTWSDLEILQLDISGDFLLTETKEGFLYLHLSIRQGDIISGKNQDSDYLGNNRTNEFSRSNNISDTGSTNDYSISLNTTIPISTKSADYILTPAIGYALYAQNLVMTDGYQTIPSSGSFSGLNSTYDTEWKGIFIGLSIDTMLNDRHKFKLSGKYHRVDYYAEADWNLRTDFQHPKSFTHTAKGSGTTMSLEYLFKFHEKWSYNLSINSKNYTTDAGSDKTFFANGAIATTQLNEVNWTSKSIMTGFLYHF